jgi:hypothetical protein
MYTETLLPPPAIPSLELPDRRDGRSAAKKTPRIRTLPYIPLGLGPTNPPETPAKAARPGTKTEHQLVPPHKATSLPLVDRLAARDRAYGLLSGLTKLGTGWNNAEAWFALARAHEESGQADKAKEVLWWCVELEEGSAVRDWRCLCSGGYVL